MSDHREKTVVITGASAGIGAATALAFARKGWKLALGARRLDRLEAVGANAKELGASAVFIHALDVTDRESIRTFHDAATRALGPIDVLVNNAALTYFIPIRDYPISKRHRCFSVNLHAPFYLSQLVLPAMIEKHSGAIVNISSGAAIGPGRAPYPEMVRRGRGGTLYGAEKAALERFTQGLAAEVYDDGISVTCVSPSQVVPTAGTLHHKLVNALDDPRGEAPELMARAVLLLATEPCETISGRVTYSQEILKEYGLIEQGRGTGFDRAGSGYSQI